jgi:hypothetical protein
LVLWECCIFGKNGFAQIPQNQKTKKPKKQSFSKLVWARFGFRLVWKKIVFLFFCFFGFVGVLHFVEKDWFCTILTMSFVGGKACLW